MKLGTRQIRPHKRVVAFGALALAAVSLTTGVSSLALFTDTQNNTGSAFVSGTIDISVSPASAFFNVPNLMPGDDLVTPVAVLNNGSSQMRWSVDSTGTTGTGGLMDQIDVQIGLMSAATCATWDGVTPAPAASGSLASIALLDQVLNAGATTNTCFRAELPLNTGNAFQATNAGTTFAFTAEQTANNP